VSSQNTFTDGSLLQPVIYSFLTSILLLLSVAA